MSKKEQTSDKHEQGNSSLGGVIACFFGLRQRWTKWELIYIYNFSITSRSIEVRQNLDDGRVQFRVKKIAYPVHSKYFDVEDVKKALANVL